MFWYYVAPYAAGKWNVLFENQPRPYIYDSEDEALKAAHRAAKGNFEKKGAPSGVRVKEGEQWRDEATYEE
jgi:hypothetical protein